MDVGFRVYLSGERAPGRSFSFSFNTRLPEPPAPPPLTPIHGSSNLYAQVSAQIVKYQNSAQWPPFSVPQLVVMLLIYYGPLSLDDISRALMTTFPVYFNQTTADSGPQALGHAQGAFHMNFHYTNDILPEIQATIESFGAPIVAFPSISADPSCHWQYLSPRTWGVNTRESAVFLQGCLGDTAPAFNKPFRFLDLPAELRVRIYEYALGYPKSGIEVEVQPDKSPARMWAITRDYEEAIPIKSWDFLQRAHWIRLSPPATELALLLVSKLLYKEAMPVFFSQNKFVFLRLVPLTRFLKRLSDERRQCIQHVAVEYFTESAAEAGAAFRLLGTTGLRHLEIHVDEVEYDTYIKKNRQWVPVYPDRTRLPGFWTLGQIKKLDTLEVQGDCPTVREHLMKVLLKPKEKQKAKKGAGSKRKPEAIGTDAHTSKEKIKGKGKSKA